MDNNKVIIQELDLITEIRDNSFKIEQYLDYFFDKTSKKNVNSLSKENLEELNKVIKNILKRLKKII